MTSPIENEAVFNHSALYVNADLSSHTTSQWMKFLAI